MKPETRASPSIRLRLVNGEVDFLTGGSAFSVQWQLQTVTGYVCPVGPYACLAANNSGWLMVRNNQVLNGQADHCYMSMDGTCGSAVETNWRDSPAPWALNANLEWLRKFTAPTYADLAGNFAIIRIGLAVNRITGKYSGTMSSPT